MIGNMNIGHKRETKKEKRGLSTWHFCLIGLSSFMIGAKELFLSEIVAFNCRTWKKKRPVTSRVNNKKQHLNLPYIIHTCGICQKRYRGTPLHQWEKPVSWYSLVHSPTYEAIVHKKPSIPSLPVQRYPPVFSPSVHLVHFSW